MPSLIAKIPRESGFRLTPQVDLIVSGDDDLLTLGVFQGIPIVTASQAVLRVAG